MANKGVIMYVKYPDRPEDAPDDWEESLVKDIVEGAAAGGAEVVRVLYV